ncbi:unnamed protein product [Caenorhabditis auriculariae]|uniref:Protein DIS3 homolog n=1 Tax=Caenorhabditis auriculariae TaxID=2777116 RepID=A0A8S1HQY7_9PELO|nr:unnamed protein product [Caenorhabditis auriculariae]
MDLNIKQSGIHSCILQNNYFSNRSGKVYKKCTERYLRSDISCGLSKCIACADYGKNPIFKAPSLVSHNKYNENSVLIVDAPSFIRFYDIFSSPLFSNVIVTQTVWESVRAKSIPAYKKMNSLCYDEATDRFHVFMNEFHHETFSETTKIEGLSRGEELLAVVATYLKEHWAKYNVKPVIACSEETSAQRLSQHYEFVTDLRSYVQGIDSVDRQVPIPKRIFTMSIFRTRKIMEGIGKGTIKKGSFSVSRENYREASVIIDEQLTSWFITGMNCNRAVNGDIVAVQLLPESQWTAPEKKIRLRDVEEYVSTADDMAAEEDENMEDFDGEPRSKRSKRSVVPTAKVVGIIKRNWRQYCGILLPSVIKGARRHLFCPAERLIPRIRIETEQAEVLAHQRIMVSIDHWPRDSKYPLGHYVRTIGELGDSETENEVLLLEHDIPHAPFSDAVMACLPQENWVPDLQKPRVDLRHLTICSVRAFETLKS